MLLISVAPSSQWSTQGKNRVFEADRSARPADRQARPNLSRTASRASGGQRKQRKEEEKIGLPSPDMRQHNTTWLSVDETPRISLAAPISRSLVLSWLCLRVCSSLCFFVRTCYCRPFVWPCRTVWMRVPNRWSTCLWPCCRLIHIPRCSRRTDTTSHSQSHTQPNMRTHAHCCVSDAVAWTKLKRCSSISCSLSPFLPRLLNWLQNRVEKMVAKQIHLEAMAEAQCSMKTLLLLSTALAWLDDRRKSVVYDKRNNWASQTNNQTTHTLRSQAAIKSNRTGSPRRRVFLLLCSFAIR